MKELQIDSRHLCIIKEILGTWLKATSVFGSRARGDARPLSDLDLYIDAEITSVELQHLMEKFEDSNLPYKVDLLTPEKVDLNFLSQIKKDLRKIS